MATVDEILAITSPNDAADDVPEYSISADLRQISKTSGSDILGVEGDKDVNVIQFVMPKSYRGYDMSSFSCYVSYINAGGESGFYKVPAIAAYSEDDTKLTFTWLVSKSVTRYQGDVSFAVHLRLFDDDGNILKAFNTVSTSATVLDGIPAGGYDDAIASIDKAVNDTLSGVENGTY